MASARAADGVSSRTRSGRHPLLDEPHEPALERARLARPGGPENEQRLALAGDGLALIGKQGV